MKVIGLTCGVGSMQIGAKQLGMEVLGGIEWRPYYRHTDTFERNFDYPLWKDPSIMSTKEKEMMTGADIAFGHP